jgi:hypothetical protein
VGHQHHRHRHDVRHAVGPADRTLIDCTSSDSKLDVKAAWNK